MSIVARGLTRPARGSIAAAGLGLWPQDGEPDPTLPPPLTEADLSGVAAAWHAAQRARKKRRRRSEEALILGKRYLM